MVRSRTVVLVECEKDGEESPGGGSNALKGSCRVDEVAEEGLTEAGPGIVKFKGRLVPTDLLFGGGPIETEARFSAIDGVGETGDGSEVCTLELLRE